MNRLEQLIEPFHLMTPAAQLEFVRKLRADRSMRKVRPSEAKATKRSNTKKQTKVLEAVAKLSPGELQRLVAKLIG